MNCRYVMPLDKIARYRAVKNVIGHTDADTGQKLRIDLHAHVIIERLCLMQAECGPGLFQFSV